VGGDEGAGISAGEMVNDGGAKEWRVKEEWEGGRVDVGEERVDWCGRGDMDGGR